MPDDKFYDYLNFNNTIDCWTDFLQPKFTNRNLNEIKEIDICINSYDNYIFGSEFFSENKGFKTNYLEVFEDNFRKQLEECDIVDKLFFTVDQNSIWGGIKNVFINEIVSVEVPKVLKIIQGVDDTNCFETNDSENISKKCYNTKKIMNYFFYYSDLIDSDQTFLYSPIRYNEDLNFFQSLFNYNYDCDNVNSYNYNSASNFYTSSLLGLDNLNMIMPLLCDYKENENSNLNKNTVNNEHYYNINPKLDYISSRLIRNNYINFYHSDICFYLKDEIKYENNSNKFSNNGHLFTYNKNIKKYSNVSISKNNYDLNTPLSKYNWDKHFSYISKFKNSNYAISNGYNSNYRMMSYPIDKFLNITSSLNCLNTNTIPLPFCFPRYLYNNNNKNFIKDIEILSIYSHDYLYANNFLNFIPEYIKKNNFNVEKYLRKIDLNKYLEVSDRLENFYKLFDFYDNFKDVCDSDEENSYDY